MKSIEEEKQILNLKLDQKIQFETLRHQNKMIELKLELEKKTYCQGCESVEVDPEKDYKDLCKSCQ
jgi:hypothetical protein